MGNFAALSAVGVVCLAVGAVVSGLAVYYSTQPAEMNVEGLCILASSSGNRVSGSIKFQQASSSDHIMIKGNITGLSAGKHGFHIHTLGADNGQCAMAMGHYNPHDKTHGGPDFTDRHIGDLGNIMSEGENSPVNIAIEDSEASLFGPYSIFGRAIVIHAKEDTLDPNSASGDAGGRIACCTIMHS